MTVPARPTVYKNPPVTPATKDFNFQECLATTPLLEVWLVETAREEKKVIKFLYGASGPSIKQQQEALMRLQSLDHPAINPVEVLECSPGRITLLTDYIGQSLRDYHKKFLSRNVRGIPRIELLDILRTAAESLDYLYRQHSVQHLGLNPRNLLWTEGRLVIDEFGFLQLIWLPAGQTSTQRNKRYSAPEVFKSKVSPTSDQYSLALIYAELLTGTFPRAKPNSTSGLTINLDLLTPTDREIVARALDSDPNKRWSSCTELIDALEQGDSASAREESNQDEFSIMVQSSLPAAREISLKNSKETSRKLKRILSELIRSGGGSAEPISIDQPPEFSPDRQVLFHRFTAGLPLGEARLKLNSLREELFGQQINDDPQFYVFHVSMPSRFWEQWIGRQPGLEISISLAQHHPLVATPIEVTINIKSFQCNKKRGKELVEEVGTSILEQIRACLLVNSEKRVQERLLWPHPVEVYPVQPNGTFGEKINCRGKDLSLTGIGFYLPHQLETSEIQVYLPATKKTQPVSIAATLVRAKPCVDGWYEVGALFRLTNSRNSTEEICMK